MYKIRKRKNVVQNTWHILTPQGLVGLGQTSEGPDLFVVTWKGLERVSLGSWLICFSLLLGFQWFYAVFISTPVLVGMVFTGVVTVLYASCCLEKSKFSLFLVREEHFDLMDWKVSLEEKRNKPGKKSKTFLWITQNGVNVNHSKPFAVYFSHFASKSSSFINSHNHFINCPIDRYGDLRKLSIKGFCFDVPPNSEGKTIEKY